MMLKVTAGEKYSAILGLGGYRPRRVVDNAEICTMIDSSDEWIRTRSGIIERRWASADETIQMMSIAAARKALDRAGIVARFNLVMEREALFFFFFWWWHW